MPCSTLYLAAIAAATGVVNAATMTLVQKVKLPPPISCNGWACAVLKADGSVQTWGKENKGGDSSKADVKSGVVQVVCDSELSGCFALKADGSVNFWGHQKEGDSSEAIKGGVVQVTCNLGACAALKADGSVQTWGDSRFGGNSSKVDVKSGVVQVVRTSYHFVALKADGSVLLWPNPKPSDDLYIQNTAWLKENIDLQSYRFASSDDLAGGVVQVACSTTACSILKADGSVKSWGDSQYDSGDSSKADVKSGVVQVVCCSSSCAALKSDGSVQTWGSSFGDSSKAGVKSGVVQVVCGGVTNGNTYAALKSDGSVQTWGNKNYGGDHSYSEYRQTSKAEDVTSGVVQVTCGDRACAALKSDGSVQSWGQSRFGGDSSKADVKSGVVQVVCSGSSCHALKSDRSVQSWGNEAEWDSEWESAGKPDVLGADDVALSSGCTTIQTKLGGFCYTGVGTAITAAVETKADKTAVTALNGKKADKTALESALTTVNITLESALTTIATLQTKLAQLEGRMDAVKDVCLATSGRRRLASADCGEPVGSETASDWCGTGCIVVTVVAALVGLALAGGVAVFVILKRSRSKYEKTGHKTSKAVVLGIASDSAS